MVARAAGPECGAPGIGIEFVTSRLNYYWRLLITGLCFLGFSAGGLLLSLLVFPPMYLFGGSAEHRRQRAKWTIQKFFSILLLVLRYSGTLRLELVGAEKLKDARAVLVLANHPSLIDIVVLLSLIPRATCVVKGQLSSNVFIGGVIRAAGYITNSTPEKLIEDCTLALEAGNAVVIFPEGTRSCPDAPLKFLRGAAHVLLKTDRLLLPVLIQCEPPTLTKGSRWHEIPPTPIRFRVVARDALRASALVDTCREPVIAARHLTTALESYFSQELRTL